MEMQSITRLNYFPDTIIPTPPVNYPCVRFGILLSDSTVPQCAFMRMGHFGQTQKLRIAFFTGMDGSFARRRVIHFRETRVFWSYVSISIRKAQKAFCPYTPPFSLLESIFYSLQLTLLARKAPFRSDHVDFEMAPVYSAPPDRTSDVPLESLCLRDLLPDPFTASGNFFAI